MSDCPACAVCDGGRSAQCIVLISGGISVDICLFCQFTQYVITECPLVSGCVCNAADLSGLFIIRIDRSPTGRTETASSINIASKMNPEIKILILFIRLIYIFHIFADLNSHNWNSYNDIRNYLLLLQIAKTRCIFFSYIFCTTYI